MSYWSSKTAVITGATGALGQCVTRCLAERGCLCHATYLHEESRRAFEADAKVLEQRIIFHQVDVTDPPAVARFYRNLDESKQAIDFLLNLAGGFRMAPIERSSADDWNHLIHLNATSVFLNCRHAVPLMKRRYGGRIINIAARSAVEAPAGMSAYVAGKAAVIGLSKSLARELRDEGLTVNVILPSIIDTPANRRAMPKADPAKWPTPLQIAETILFLLSERAAAISGAVVPVYGRA